MVKRRRMVSATCGPAYFLYPTYLITNLETFLPAGLSDSKANGIDSAGNIVGFAFSTDGTTHAVLWKPVPEPPTLVMLFLAAAGILLRRRRIASQVPRTRYQMRCLVYRPILIRAHILRYSSV
jgi:probable HAF family extracellular repeat protein